MTFNKTKKILISSFLVIALFCILFFGAFFYIKNKITDVNFIKSIIKNETGLVLDCPKIEAKIKNASFEIYTPKFLIKEETSKKPFLDIKEGKIQVKILPLFVKKISFGDFETNSIEINAKRLQNGSFDFAKYIKIKEKPFFKIDLSSLRTRVLEYEINIEDLIVKNGFTVKGGGFYSDRLDFNGKFALETGGSIIVKGETPVPYSINIDFIRQNGVLKLNKQDLFLTSVDLSFLKGYFSKVLDISLLEGKLDIYSNPNNKNFNITFYLDKPNIIFNYKGDKNSIVSKKPLVGELNFNIQNKDLIIEKSFFMGENIDTAFFGSIKNLFSFKNIAAEINLNIKDTSAKNVVEILPDTLFPLQETYIKNLKIYKADGIINGNLEVKYKNKDNYGVFGKLDFQDVYIKERPKNAQTSFGNCEFKGRDVFINVYANVPNGAILTVFGKSKLEKNPYGEFEIISHNPLDLEFAQSILNPLQKILVLKLGPLPYMNLKGKGVISLITKGTKLKSKLYGYFETKNAEVSMKGLNATLKNGNVKVLFNEDKIIYNNASGIIENSPIKIDGEADTSGNLTLDAFVQNINAKSAIKIAQTSSLVTEPLDGAAFLKSFHPETGNIDFYLNVSGNVPPEAVFGEPLDSVLVKGKILFKGINLYLDPKIKAKNLKGELTFENNAKFNLTADIFDSPFIIKGQVEQKGAKGKLIKGKPSTLDLELSSKNISSKTISDFILDNLELFIPQSRMFAKNLALIFKNNKFQLEGNIKTKGEVYSNSFALDLSGFDFNGKISGVNKSGSDFTFKSGDITLRNKNVYFNNLKIIASGIDFLINGNIDKFAGKNSFNNLKLVFYNSKTENYIKILCGLLPDKIQNLYQRFVEYNGYISGSIKLYGDKIEGEFIPKNLSFKDAKENIKISLNSGKIKLKNDKTYLNSINLNYGGLPLYTEGFIQTDGSLDPEFNIYYSTNLSEENCDKLINPYIPYPLLITGETQIKGRLLGHRNAYTSYLNLILNKESDMSFMGLKLGDVDTKREIASKIKFAGNYANINYIKYSKYVQSQNNRETPYDIIKIYGGLKLTGKDILLQNLRVLTPNPAPVRFLNPIFKKSIVKGGLFTSDILLNGTPQNIQANGSLEFSKVFIPLYNSAIDNIKITLNNSIGTAKFRVSFFDTIIDASIEFLNRTMLPFTINNISLHSENIQIENLLKGFAELSGGSVSSSSPSLLPSDILIKKGNILVDKVVFNDVEGENLKINFSHSKDSELKIDNIYLSIADGLIKGSGKFNTDKKDISFNSDFINCNADRLTKAFFNLSGQIYGIANGSFTISMKDYTPSDYIDKIKADANFEILNGKMPKLGSIEYLLRASNVIKSGVLGLTINNVLQLLTPYKHGDFNKIAGNFKIQDASIKDLKIYSQGENLSTYTHGYYDIKSGNADMEVLGKLSKKISNLLGSIGNTSVISILNLVTKNKVDELAKTEAMKNIQKIPFIDLNNDDFRLFTVKLNGRVTAEDFVKSFMWLN